MRMYIGLSKDRGSILFAFASAGVVSKNLNTPNWNSMTDDTIARSKGIEVLGVSLLNCEKKTQKFL